MENTHFSITLFAKGWTEKLAEPTDEHKESPNKEMITKVTGVNPGYGATCTTLLMSALMVLKESDKMPDKYVNLFIYLLYQNHIKEIYNIFIYNNFPSVLK